MLALVTAADCEPALKAHLRAFIGELRTGVAGAIEAAGLAPGAEQVTFMHSVVVGAAVLQIARDNAEVRREARAVIRQALACIGGKG